MSGFRVSDSGCRVQGSGFLWRHHRHQPIYLSEYLHAGFCMWRHKHIHDRVMSGLWHLCGTYVHNDANRASLYAYVNDCTYTCVHISTWQHIYIYMFQ